MGRSEGVRHVSRTYGASLRHWAVATPLANEVSQTGRE